MLKLENKTEGKSGGGGWGVEFAQELLPEGKWGRKPHAKDQKLKCFELLNRNEAGRARAVPLIRCCSFAFRGCGYPKSAAVWKQMLLPPTSPQKVTEAERRVPVPTSVTSLHLITRAFPHVTSRQEKG